MVKNKTKELEIDNRENDTLICNICGQVFVKISENDEGNNPDPIVRSWGCCSWCNENIILVARTDRYKDYLKNETDEVARIYKKADKLFAKGKFLQAIQGYDELTIKSKSKYWPYWDMYLTAREIAKEDSDWNDEVGRFLKCAIDSAPAFLKEVFDQVHRTYQANLEDVIDDE